MRSVDARSRSDNGRVFKLERHIERLFDSAKAIRLEIPHTPAEVCDIVIEACRQNGIVDGYLRLVVTRGAGDLGLDPRKCPRANVIVIARPTLSIYRSPSAGIRVVTSTFRRNSPDTTSPSIKSLNYLNNVLARIEANDRGADEALMLDVHGYVAEATVDNFFIVTDHALMTPPTATNLKGVTRETLIDLAATVFALQSSQANRADCRESGAANRGDPWRHDSPSPRAAPRRWPRSC